MSEEQKITTQSKNNNIDNNQETKNKENDVVKETQKNDNKNNSKNITVWFSIIIVIVLIIVGLIYYNYNYNFNSNKDKDTKNSSSSSKQYSNIYDYISSNSELSTSLKTINLAGIEEILKTQPNLTIFIPNNEAFKKLGNEDLLNSLLSDNVNNKTFLATLLSNHIPVSTDNGALTTTLNYEDLSNKSKTENNDLYTSQSTLSVVEEKNHVYINGSKIITKDIKTGNGIVHIVDSIIFPSLANLNSLDDTSEIKMLLTKNLSLLTGNYEGKSTILNRLIVFPNSKLILNSVNTPSIIEANGLNLSAFGQPAMMINGVYPDVSLKLETNLVDYKGYGTKNLLSFLVTKIDLNFSVAGSSLPNEVKQQLILALSQNGIVLPTINETSTITVNLIADLQNNSLNITSISKNSLSENNFYFSFEGERK